jgi:asparagine synthase (glutamine-hydrolysing)
MFALVLNLGGGQVSPRLLDRFRAAVSSSISHVGVRGTARFFSQAGLTIASTAPGQGIDEHLSRRPVRLTVALDLTATVAGGTQEPGLRIDINSASELQAKAGRMGEIPLYYRVQGDFAVLSTLASIVARTLFGQIRVDEQEALRYITGHYHCAWGRERTLLEGVSRLPASTMLSLKRGFAPSASSYWDPLDEILPNTPDWKMENLAEEYRQLLLANSAILSYRDVDIVALSGGIDSATVAAAIRQTSDKQLSTLSMLNGEGALYDETALIRESSKRLSNSPHEVAPDIEQLSKELVSRLSRYDQPLATVSILGYELLIEEGAARGVERMFTGSGGDALFAGTYPAYLHHLADLFLDESKQFEHELACWISNHGTLEFPKSRDVFKNFVVSRVLHESGLRGLKTYTDLLVPEQLVSPSRRDQLKAIESPGRSMTVNSLLASYAWLEYRYHDIAPGVDAEYQMALRTGIQWVSPLLSPEIVAFGARVPAEAKIRNGRNKVLPRLALRGWVPDPVLDATTKQGFNLPFADWIKDEEYWSVIAGVIHSAKLEQEFLVPGSLEASRKLVMSGDSRAAMFLWQALSFAVWRTSWT